MQRVECKKGDKRETEDKGKGKTQLNSESNGKSVNIAGYKDVSDGM